MPATGEKPGNGEYKCIKCGMTIVLDENKDTLPVCPKCRYTRYRRQ